MEGPDPMARPTFEGRYQPPPETKLTRDRRGYRVGRQRGRRRIELDDQRKHACQKRRQVSQLSGRVPLPVWLAGQLAGGCIE